MSKKVKLSNNSFIGSYLAVTVSLSDQPSASITKKNLLWSATGLSGSIKYLSICKFSSPKHAPQNLQARRAPHSFISGDKRTLRLSPHQNAQTPTPQPHRSSHPDNRKPAIALSSPSSIPSQTTQFSTPETQSRGQNGSQGNHRALRAIRRLCRVWPCLRPHHGARRRLASH